MERRVLFPFHHPTTTSNVSRFNLRDGTGWSTRETTAMMVFLSTPWKCSWQYFLRRWGWDRQRTSYRTLPFRICRNPCWQLHRSTCRKYYCVRSYQQIFCEFIKATISQRWHLSSVRGQDWACLTSSRPLATYTHTYIFCRCETIWSRVRSDSPNDGVRGWGLGMGDFAVNSPADRPCQNVDCIHSSFTHHQREVVTDYSRETTCGVCRRQKPVLQYWRNARQEGRRGKSLLFEFCFV